MNDTVGTVRDGEPQDAPQVTDAPPAPRTRPVARVRPVRERCQVAVLVAAIHTVGPVLLLILFGVPPAEAVTDMGYFLVFALVCLVAMVLLVAIPSLIGWQARRWFPDAAKRHDRRRLRGAIGRANRRPSDA